MERTVTQAKPIPVGGAGTAGQSGAGGTAGTGGASAGQAGTGNTSGGGHTQTCNDACSAANACLSNEMEFSVENCKVQCELELDGQGTLTLEVAKVVFANMAENQSQPCSSVGNGGVGFAKYDQMISDATTSQSILQVQESEEFNACLQQNVECASNEKPLWEFNEACLLQYYRWKRK